MELPALPGVKQKDQLRRLQERHHIILRLHLEGLGPHEIADHLGVSTKTVEMCVNSDIGKQALNELRTAAELDTIDIAQMLHDGAKKAAILYRAVMMGEGEGVDATLSQRLKIGHELLQIEGFTPVQKSINVQGYMGQNPLQDLKAHNADIIEAFPTAASSVKGEEESLELSLPSSPPQQPENSEAHLRQFVAEIVDG